MPGITGTSRDETGSAGHPRRWFWIGVILLAVGVMALFICLLADLEGADEWAMALLLFVCPFLISGIYCMRRGRKALTVEVQQSAELTHAGQPGVKPSAFKKRKVTVQETSTGSEIVIKLPVWFRVVAWFELLALPPVGIWMLGMTTKVTFNQLLGHITIVRGHVPLFLWFLRTKRISRDEARSVFVRSVKRTAYGAHFALATSSPSTYTAYEVRVKTSSGKEVTLYNGGYSRDVADYLAKRILDFAQEADLGVHRLKLDETRQLKSRTGAKFSMRIEEAFQATFASGALGMVVGGTVEQGTIRNGDEVEVRGYRRTKRVKVFEVDTPTGFGAAGEKIQLLIEDLTERDVMLGDIVERV